MGGLMGFHFTRPQFKPSWAWTDIVQSPDGKIHLVVRGRMIGRSKYDPATEDRNHAAVSPE